MKRILLVLLCSTPVLGWSQAFSDQRQADLLAQGHIRVGLYAGGSLSSGSTGLVWYTTPRI